MRSLAVKAVQILAGIGLVSSASTTESVSLSMDEVAPKSSKHPINNNLFNHGDGNRSMKLIDMKSTDENSPLVGLESRVFGYQYDGEAYTDSAGRDVGLETGFTLDLSLGYEILLYWYSLNSENFIVFSPSGYGEVAGKLYFGIQLYFIQFWFYLDLEAFKGSPLEYQALWSMDNMSHYCQSLGAYMDIFNFVVRTEVHVNECWFGIFGFLNNPDDFFDCFWRRYAPFLPLYEISVLDQGDLTYDYLPWACNYHDQAQPIITIGDRGQEVIIIDGEEIDIDDIGDGNDIEIPEIGNI